MFILWLFAGPLVLRGFADWRTQDATASLSCSTGVGETDCAITLPSQHEYTTMSFVTVTETSPGSGDKTSETTIASSRDQLTVTGLLASTSYNFDVDYKEQNDAVDNGGNELLRQMPWAAPLGLLLAGILLVGSALGLARIGSRGVRGIGR